jgi:hypothetical protein
MGEDAVDLFLPQPRQLFLLSILDLPFNGALIGTDMSQTYL